MHKRAQKLAFAGAVLALSVIPLGVWAAQSFTDVPESNVFHADIQWLADAGVTKGCNPPDNTEFCPSDNVTREQMAAFMHRLAANQVVDAAELGGKTAAEITADATAAAEELIDSRMVRYLVEMDKGDDPVVLAEVGPLTYTAKCLDNAGETQGLVEYTSSVGPWWNDAAELAAGDVVTAADISIPEGVADYEYWYGEVAIPSVGFYIADDGYKNTVFLEHGSDVDCVFVGVIFPHQRAS